MAPARRSPADWPPIAVRAFWLATAALALVVLVAGVRTSLGWLATADDAFLTLRARNVLAGHPPLLSTASSAGAGSAEPFNHPGAAMLWLTAPVVRLLGSGAMPVAMSLVNAAALVAVSWLLRRNARAVTAGAVLAAGAALVWSMGSGLLTDVWNPHSVLLAYLLAVVATWAVVRGDAVAPVAGALAVSLVGQTHLGYALVCLPLVVLLAGVPPWWAVRASRRGGRAEARARWRWFAAAVVAALVSVLPPVIEQVGAGSDGNMARIVRSGAGEEPGIGVRPALALLADKVVVPPVFARGSWTDPVYPASSLPGPALPAALALLVVVLAAALVTAVRRRDAEVRDLLVLVGGLLVVGVVVASRLPPIFHLLRLSSVRWLWPLSALTWAAVAVAPLEWVGDRAGRAGRGRVAVALCAVAVALAVATVPVHNEGLSGSVPSQQAILSELWSEAGDRLGALDSVELEGGVTGGQLYVVPGLVNLLDESGVEVGVSDPVQLQQAGDWMRASGQEEWVLTVLGPGRPAPPGAELVASHRPLAPAEEAAVAREVAEVAASIDADDLRAPEGLDARGRRNLVEPVVERWRADPEGTLGSLAFAGLLEAGLLEVSGRDTRALAALALRAASVPTDGMDLWLRQR